MLETRNFLLPDATFAIEMVALLVVLVVMTRYVVPRIRAGMQARGDEINRSLAAAREAEARRAVAQAQAEEIRVTARREARWITEQARATRDHLIAEGRRAGVNEYRWLSGRAERELRRRTDTATKQAQRQARVAASAAACAYLGEDIDLARVERLVDAHFEFADPRAGVVDGCAVARHHVFRGDHASAG